MKAELVLVSSLFVARIPSRSGIFSSGCLMEAISSTVRDPFAFMSGITGDPLLV